MKTAGKIIGLILLTLAAVAFSLVVSKWIWSWDIPEWLKVLLISS